jgi:hypothetical protein
VISTHGSHRWGLHPLPPRPRRYSARPVFAVCAVCAGAVATAGDLRAVDDNVQAPVPLAELERLTVRFGQGGRKAELGGNRSRERVRAPVRLVQARQVGPARLAATQRASCFPHAGAAGPSIGNSSGTSGASGPTPPLRRSPEPTAPLLPRTQSNARPRGGPRRSDASAALAPRSAAGRRVPDRRFRLPGRAPPLARARVAPPLPSSLSHSRPLPPSLPSSPSAGRRKLAAAGARNEAVVVVLAPDRSRGSSPPRRVGTRVVSSGLAVAVVAVSRSPLAVTIVPRGAPEAAPGLVGQGPRRRGSALPAGDSGSPSQGPGTTRSSPSSSSSLPTSDSSEGSSPSGGVGTRVGSSELVVAVVAVARSLAAHRFHGARQRPDSSDRDRAGNRAPSVFCRPAAASGLWLCGEIGAAAAAVAAVARLSGAGAPPPPAYPPEPGRGRRAG